MTEDEKWMHIAIKEAFKAEEQNEVPVGAVLVRNGLLIAKAHNQPISKNDATAHAEIEVVRKAGKKLNNYRLPNTSLYVTLEPCSMCLGAIIHARVSRVIFGASDSKMGAFVSSIDLSSELCFNHKIVVDGGILAKDCQNILQSFFKSRRK